MNDTDLVTVPLIAGMASGIFAGFCPSWFTVASPFFHDQEAREGNIKRIRWGEASATALVVATGWALSAHTRSPAPLVVSVAVCAVFIAGYEYMITHPATEDSSPASPDKRPGALHWTRAS